MSVLGYIVVFTLLGSIVSLIGGVILLLREKYALKISHLLASFAAGTLLGTAFFDLLPEASHEAEEAGDINIFLWALIGLLIFFLLEHFLSWFHHHHPHETTEHKKTVVPLIILGDSLHNFLDGVVIAATFLVSIPLGIVTSIAVAAHEIPQEIGDFGIMLNKGVKPRKVLFLNLISAAASIFGAVITFFAQDLITGYIPIILALTAGFFIYIAASDLIPEIHSRDVQHKAFFESMLLILGVVVIYLFTSFLEGSH